MGKQACGSCIHPNVDLCTTQKNRSSHFSSKGELHQWNLEAAGVPQLQGGSIYDICRIGPVVGSGHLHPRNVTIPANPSNHNLCCQSKLKLWVLTGYTKKCINGPPKLDTLNLFQDFRGLHCAFQPCCHPPSHQPAPDQSAKALMDSPMTHGSHLWPHLWQVLGCKRHPQLTLRDAQWRAQQHLT